MNRNTRYVNVIAALNCFIIIIYRRCKLKRTLVIIYHFIQFNASKATLYITLNDISILYPQNKVPRAPFKFSKTRYILQWSASKLITTPATSTISLNYSPPKKKKKPLAKHKNFSSHVERLNESKIVRLWKEIRTNTRAGVAYHAVAAAAG